MTRKSLDYPPGYFTLRTVTWEVSPEEFENSLKELDFQTALFDNHPEFPKLSILTKVPVVQNRYAKDHNIRQLVVLLRPTIFSLSRPRIAHNDRQPFAYVGIFYFIPVYPLKITSSKKSGVSVDYIPTLHHWSITHTKTIDLISTGVSYASKN